MKQRTAQGLEWIGLFDPEDGETKYAQKFQGQTTQTADTPLVKPTQISAAAVSAFYFCVRQSVAATS